MAAHDPTERILLARIAAAERWARTPDRAAALDPANKARDERFYRQVDEEFGPLDPEVREKLVAAKRTAFYTRLGLKSAQARRARGKAKQLEAEVESALSEVDGAVA